MKNFYTIEQITDGLGVSTRTVRRWIHDELLVAHRINGDLLGGLRGLFGARRDD
jgi:excisionase family DNA binding protein